MNVVRDKAGFTAEQFATLPGVNICTAAHYSTGRRPIPADRRDRIAAIAGVPRAELIEDER